MRPLYILPTRLDRTPVFQAYIRDTARAPQLQPHQLAALLHRYSQDDDAQALDTLVRSHLRFVISIALQYQHQCQHLTVMDLVEEGNIGLLRAIRTADPLQAATFLTYASHWIRQYILAAISQHQHIVPLPDMVQQMQGPVRRYQQQFVQRECRQPAAHEVAEALCIPHVLARAVLYSMHHDVSLDAPLPTQDDEDPDAPHTLADQMPDGDTPHQERRAYLHSLRTDLGWAMRTALTPTQRTVLVHLYGLDRPACTVDALASRLGISHQRVGQLRDQALHRLRRSPYVDVLRAY